MAPSCRLFTPTPSAIAATEAKIETVEKKIEAVETSLSGGPAYLGVADGNFQEKEKQLREERGSCYWLLKKPAAAAVSLSGACVAVLLPYCNNPQTENKMGMISRSLALRLTAETGSWLVHSSFDFFFPGGHLT